MNEIGAQELEDETRKYPVIPSDSRSDTVAPAGHEIAQGTARKASRRRILKSGVIAFNDRFSALPCTVRDLSPSGAHLHVEGTTNVPNTFELIIELDGLEAQCEVAWRKDKEIGVRFTSPPRMGTPRRSQIVKALVPQQAPSLRRKPLA